MESEAGLIDPTTVFDNARQRLVTDAGPRPPTNPASTPRYAQKLRTQKQHYQGQIAELKAKLKKLEQELAAVTNGFFGCRFRPVSRSPDKYRPSAVMVEKVQRNLKTLHSCGFSPLATPLAGCDLGFYSLSHGCRGSVCLTERFISYNVRFATML